jgi:sugar phosphate isomerase/epimerase
MFPGTPEAREKALDNRRAVDEALELGAPCLVLVVGGLPAGSKDLLAARQQVRDGLSELLDYARPLGMPLAIEPCIRCTPPSAPA